MPQDLNDRELDELAGLLDATPGPLQPLDVPMLDGYLAGVLVQPRIVPIGQWLPPLFDFERRPLPEGTAAAWLARCTSLIERRRDALAAGIGEDGFFDPVIVDVDQLPPVSEYEQPTTPVSRALMPWAAGFQWAQECFPDLEATADAAVGSALARIYRHLPAQGNEDRELIAALDREQPLKDLDAGLEDLVQATVELWDLVAEQRFAVATIRRDTPKVGRNDPCPCGSSKKFKACHGR